ncbi:MAG TPA: methyltransferase domain-containing protein [Burkholderiales bacterium]|nr:methyltransferase domain-containing protein [Burkholderiales bacterium]
MAQDSSRPDFWDKRFREGVTPWDAGDAPPKLAVWLQKKKPGLKVLVPGCGSGYEVRLFAEHGHDVLAIDFSDAAIEAARRELGPLSRLVKKADFFELQEGQFDLVYERAFLCALPRALWPAWGTRVAELVRPGGELAGFYYLDDNPRGPPFGISREGLHQLLKRRFDVTSDEPVPPVESLPVFRGKEIWQVWKRRL